MTTFAHHELHTPDPAAAKKFYGAVFGWTHQDMPMPEGVYTMFSGSEGPFGGMVQAEPGVAPMWLGYVAVRSLDNTLAKAHKAGATVLVGKTEIPGMGWFAWFKDPQGVDIAVWEAAPKSEGAAAAGKKKAGKKKAGKKKAGKKDAGEKKAGEKKAGKKKAGKKKAGKDKPAKDKPAKEKPAKDKPAKNKPAKDKPAKDKPAKDKPAKNKTGKRK
jgi:predicted enzyme related to lactoylglutathione lyase